MAVRRDGVAVTWGNSEGVGELKDVVEVSASSGAACWLAAGVFCFWLGSWKVGFQDERRFLGCFQVFVKPNKFFSAEQRGRTIALKFGLVSMRQPSFCCLGKLGCMWYRSSSIESSH